MIHHAQFEQWVPFPVDRVFLFFANPENLPRIMPPETDTRIDKFQLAPPPSPPKLAQPVPLAGVGSEIHTSFRLVAGLPFRARWIARITEFEWNHHFADIQEKGPFKSFHHRHEFADETRDEVKGTRVRDHINYEIGFSIAGSIAQKLFAGPQMAGTFLYRQQALENLLRRTAADR